MDFSKYKYIIGGSGLTGSVIAERIANDMGENVLVLEKRDHNGGNCASETEPMTGIEYHKYGTHIFHTSKTNVWDYIAKFASFNNFVFQALTVYKKKVYQMPVNLETINSFYGVNLRPFEVKQFIEDEINKGLNKTAENFEEYAICRIGKPLYEALIKGYTKKQWRREPEDLPVAVIKRLPFRTNYNENYYFDKWQGIPVEEYNSIFRKLLNSEKIKILNNTDILEVMPFLPKNSLFIHTGPIDSFFDFRFGKLEWRSLRFENEILEVEDFQGTSIMYYAEENIPYTRIHEPRHLHPEREYSTRSTLIIKEYPDDNAAELFYPVTDTRNQRIYEKYCDLANGHNLIFAGRIGSYSYLDMDCAIEQALNLYDKIKNDLIIKRIIPEEKY